jgi:UTP--glucose-1-phosphate uridylyltransferase
LGTRFLPATKASPKEMLPVVDKPLIQYAAEEAIAAGITELIFVTSSSKRAIEDHFDKNRELEAELERGNKQELLELVRNIVPSNVTCVYLRQPQALGLGHAVLCAQPLIRDEPFAVILADDLIAADTPCLKQMVDIYQRYGRSLLGVQTILREDSSKYGVIAGNAVDERLYRLQAIVEKPKPEEAPSELGVVGRYILDPRIMDILATTERGKGGEIQLTDAIATLLEEEAVYAYAFAGKRYDCGDKLGYLIATVEYARQHPSLKQGFEEYLREVVAAL